MRTIRCQNTREKKYQTGRTDPDAPCRRIVVPNIDETINQRIVEQCPICKTFWEIRIKDGVAHMKTIDDKHKINMRKEIEYKVEEHQVRIF